VNQVAAFEIIVLKICGLILRTNFLLLVRHVKWQVKTQQYKINRLHGFFQNFPIIKWGRGENRLEIEDVQQYKHIYMKIDYTTV
jgi:hypothetical protein